MALQSVYTNYSNNGTVSTDNGIKCTHAEDLSLFNKIYYTLTD